MCGRFALFTPRSRIAEQYFGRTLADPDPPPRYNVPPGTRIDLITGPDRAQNTVLADTPDHDVHGATNRAVVFRESHWGFRPPWVKDDRAPAPINAKAETVASSRYFKHAFLHHRGLVPTDGWFEWRRTEHGKQPYFIRHRDGEVLFLAAIWEPLPAGDAQEDTDVGQSPDSRCAIITQPAAGGIAHIHDRMPMVLDPECRRAWLEPALEDLDGIRRITKRLHPARLEALPVSTRVNKPQNNDPQVLQPLPDEPGG